MMAVSNTNGASVPELSAYEKLSVNVQNLIGEIQQKPLRFGANHLIS
jgi:hypothetical protein